MPVKPIDFYIQLVCEDCGWHKTIRMRSDVLVYPPSCASCGSEKLSVSPAALIRSLFTDPVGYVLSLIKGR